MTTETAAKKDIQKLQRAIVDGLEDVKAQDIQVFNTEKLSPLFERVMIASGTSNRQTKALAASVRDSVREAGFAKPRMEGEDNGEWIIVDCGQAVVHIMQPAIRQYYHLEDLWGESPVRLKFGADKPVQRAAAEKKADKSSEKSAPTGSLRRSSAAQKGQAALAPAKKSSGAKKSAPRKAAPKRSSGTSAPVKTVKVNAPKPAAKKAVTKPAAKSAAKPAAKKSSSAKPAAKPVAKKAPARKSPSRKA